MRAAADATACNVGWLHDAQGGGSGHLGEGAASVIETLKVILFGLGMGVLVAAPVGPVNIICIQRALERGFWGGLAAGIGATVADGILALAAASGIKAISGVIADYKTPLQFIGGLILIGFGAKLLTTPVLANGTGNDPQPTDAAITTSARADATDVNEAADPDAAGIGSALRQQRWTIPQTFFLTITNPGAVLGMFALVASAGTALGGLQSYDQALLLVGSVMAGSLLWWAGLSKLISRLRHRLSDTGLLIINEAAGSLLLIFGLVLITRAAIEASGG